MSAPDALWQEFFTIAQAVGQKPLSLADKGLAIAQLGLHYRARQIFRQLTAGQSIAVQSGPFAGMALGPHAEHMSACLARWLGIYEHPLHGHIEMAIAKNYDTLINIGAGEGYYAIGMARRCPSLQVIAADTNPDMQNACTNLAALNAVSDRISIHGQLTPTDLAQHIKGKTLIICDIEGAEKELLDIATCPALLNCDLIIEMHDVYVPGISAQLTAMFEKTHAVTHIEAAPAPVIDKPFIKEMPELEHFLLGYEGRAGYTPWGVFIRR